MTEPSTNVGDVNYEMAVNLRKTLCSLELIFKDALVLLQQKSKSLSRCSPQATSPDPVISRLDGLSRSVVKLKEDFERSTTVVCPNCGLYNLKDLAIPQHKRRTSLDGAQGDRPSKRRHTENGSIAQLDHQPDGLELPGSPGALIQHAFLEDVANNALAVFADDGNLDRGADISSDVAEDESIGDDDERGDVAQADNVAVERGSQQDSDIILAEHDWEQSSQLGNSSSVASPSPSSPASIPCSTTPSSLTPSFQSTPPSSLDRQSSTKRYSHARNSPKFSTASQRTSPSSTRAPASLDRDKTLEQAASQEIIHNQSRTYLPNASSTMVKELLRADPQCKIPRFDRIAPPDARVLRLATAIRGRDAVKQFCDLVSAKRDLQLYNRLFPKCTGAARRLVILGGLRNTSKIVKYVNQYLFAAEIEKGRDGALRVASNIKRDVVQASGLSAAQYDYHLRLGMKWRHICGVFEGLLCFILADKHNRFGVSQADYHTMSDRELQLFHYLLTDDYTSAICTAGKAFQQSLIDHDPSYFAWETSKLSNPLHELPEDDMLLYIKPVPLLLEDKYCAAEFPNWPNPTLISSTEKQCEWCTSRSCNCYLSWTPNAKPRIMAYPEKGLGLQASSEDGGVVYRSKDIIGFLTGKLVPPGTQALNSNRLIDFYKCQIDCNDEGNEFRLLNHACAKHAIARLEQKKVSGRFRLAVVAGKDIYNGAEITIADHSGTHPYTCEGCKDGR